MATEADREEPIDPDVDVHVAEQRGELVRTHGAVLLVIALGGGLGALARYAVGVLLPIGAWATFGVNVLGCLLIGVLMVLIHEVWSVHRLLRPFIGVGVLGGFTTFSTYAVEFAGLLRPGSVLPAGLYLVGTVLGALLAVLAGVALTRSIVGKQVQQ
ncbi:MULTISPECIES: CrcB family protein [unclassified Saccharopolyspora]|uniref:fluoride efflux transporter FluC n=1 Tax=Saccharopolyspora TaxID=1835 RepID=UPI00190BED53|nr:CrcB family protein [Saccharopolyspora sp. HNM0986]MBK0866433.1 CrcB family protein [Saccharopolyspora sp. HNM0986]